MAQVQLALDVQDIDRTAGICATLLRTGPAKRRPGYTSFAVAAPPLELVLVENGEAPAGSLNHVGIGVGSTADVTGARKPAEADGAACCANRPDRFDVASTTPSSCCRPRQGQPRSARR